MKQYVPEGVIQMSLAQLSPNSILATPSQLNPLTPNVQHVAIAQASQAAQSSIARKKTDTVTISSQAAQMNSRAARLSEEPREDPTERAAERKQGQG